MQVVELDGFKKEAVRVLSDPVEVYKAMRLGFLVALASEVDIDRQIMDGCTVQYLFDSKQIVGVQKYEVKMVLS